MRQTVRLLGLALFMGSLTLLGWWWVVVVGSGPARVNVRAIPIDTALFSVFALHHSLLARAWAKTRVERLVPRDLVRSFYVWIASLLLVAMCLLWEPVGGTVYRVSGVAALVPGAMQLLGIVIGTLAVRRISVRELAGLAEPRDITSLEHRGPYGFIRHPLYLGWVLIFFGTAHMTGDRLLFAVVSTIYLLIAMPYEEAGLLKQFGGRYLEYRQTVRWRLIPYLH